MRSAALSGNAFAHPSYSHSKFRRRRRFFFDGSSAFSALSSCSPLSADSFLAGPPKADAAAANIATVDVAVNAPPAPPAPAPPGPAALAGVVIFLRRGCLAPRLYIGYSTS